MKRLFPVLAVLLGVALTSGITVAGDEADRAAIREAVDQTLKAAQAKDVVRWASHFTDDATLFPPNHPIVKGKEAIKELMSEWIANPDFAVNWETAKVEVSETGDLGFASGTYEVTLNNEEGKPVSAQGKWVSVYKKQADGAWKCVNDIWNTDQPPA